MLDDTVIARIDDALEHSLSTLGALVPEVLMSRIAGKSCRACNDSI
jgi:hypothetical protein